jgi:hypothetical protein
MRRLAPMALIASMMALGGCATERSDGSRTLSGHLCDLIGYNIRGGKTQEEFDAEIAQSKQDHQAFLDSIERGQDNKIKYGSSY